MRTFLYTLAITSVLAYGCTPNNGSTPSSTPNGPIVNNSNVYGGTMRADFMMYHTPSSNGTTGYYDYSAWFVDANGVLIDGGTLKANNMVLGRTSVDNSYFVSVFGFALGPVKWIGGGNSASGVPAFSHLTQFIPEIPLMYPDTIHASQGYNFNHYVIKADTIEYTVENLTGAKVKKMVLDSSSSIILSPADVSVFNTSGDSLRVTVKAWNQENKTIGLKYYKFINCATLTRASRIEP